MEEMFVGGGWIVANNTEEVRAVSLFITDCQIPFDLVSCDEGGLRDCAL